MDEITAEVQIEDSTLVVSALLDTVVNIETGQGSEYDNETANSSLVI